MRSGESRIDGRTLCFRKLKATRRMLWESVRVRKHQETSCAICRHGFDTSMRKFQKEHQNQQKMLQELLWNTYHRKQYLQPRMHRQDSLEPNHARNTIHSLFFRKIRMVLCVSVQRVQGCEKSNTHNSQSEKTVDIMTTDHRLLTEESEF